MLIRLKKAQSIAEYAILLSLVIAAAVTMQNEIRRVLQGRMHDAANYYARQTAVLGSTQQWEPVESTKTTTSSTQSTRDEFFNDENSDLSMAINATSSSTSSSVRIE